MKKIIMLILLTTTIFAYENIVQEQTKEEAQVICKKNYLFLIVTIYSDAGNSVSVTQILQQSKNVPQPMKCKEI